MATIQDIHAAADALVANGKRPTLAAIRAAVGGGSYTTISEALKTWSGRQASSAPVTEAAPLEVESAASALAGQVWRVAQALAAGRLETERKALEEIKQQLEAERQEAAELADQLAAELEQAQSKVTQLTAELAGVRQDAHKSEVRAVSAEKALDECRGKADVLTADLLTERQQREASLQAHMAATIEAAELRGKLAALEKATK